MSVLRKSIRTSTRKIPGSAGLVTARGLVMLFVIALLSALALTLILAAPLFPAQAAEEEVVSLGANLSSQQRQEMLDLFGVSADQVTVLEVTNKEERQYLEGIISDVQIGTRSISSVYVRIKGDGSGIDVQTKNITYVTERTYGNALVTAGISDADIFAAAPFPVSGTAALTGIFKAFEVATGEEIPEEAKEVATKELVDTAEIGEEVNDQSGVADLIQRAKEEVIEKGLSDPGAIREVVIRIAGELNINLTSEQIDRVVQILVQVQNLNINVDDLRNQLQDFSTKIGISGEDAEGIWASIKDLFQRLWDAIFGS